MHAQLCGKHLISHAEQMQSGIIMPESIVWQSVAWPCRSIRRMTEWEGVLGLQTSLRRCVPSNRLVC